MKKLDRIEKTQLTWNNLNLHPQCLKHIKGTNAKKKKTKGYR